MDDYDDYLEYKMLEDSRKKDKLNAYIKKSNRPDSKYPPLRVTKKKNDPGCSGWLILIVLVIGAISIFGSCSKTGSKSYSSDYRSSYSSSYSSSRSDSSSGGYGSSESKNSSYPYNAKSCDHPEDMYQGRAQR